MKLLSIIIPAYNEVENIQNTADVIKDILQENEINYELIFINDGSKDDTMNKICEIAKEDKRIIGVEFSRNFGKEAAIFAGLQVCNGDCAVVIDCDLQHPPEIIPEMYRLWEQEDFEIVEGIKANRGNESFLHSFFVKLFYNMMSKLMKMNMENTSDYKLLDRKVIDVLLKLTERNTFFRALSFWTGYKTKCIKYEVQERKKGTSKWSWYSLLKYAIVNVSSFSTMPLQMITGLGFLSLIGSFFLFIQTLVKYIGGNAVEGFTTVILLILIIGGFIMISMGIIGHYLACIYEEVKGRPKYIIKNIVGISDKAGSD